MSATKYCDVVASVPFPGGHKYVKVGVMLQMEVNDASKGPGFVIMLDRYFNPAGVPLQPGGSSSSVALSTYWPRADDEKARRKAREPFHKDADNPDDVDDDIPF